MTQFDWCSLHDVEKRTVCMAALLTLKRVAKHLWGLVSLGVGGGVGWNVKLETLRGKLIKHC